jgi:hypothetical protein
MYGYSHEWLARRVTSLAEFLPNGRFLDNFKSRQIFWATFPPGIPISYALILTKNGLGFFLYDF